MAVENMRRVLRGARHECGDWIFTGYTEREENVWVDANTEELMKWENWRKGEPNNWGGNEDCTFLRWDSNQIDEDTAVNISDTPQKR